MPGRGDSNVEDLVRYYLREIGAHPLLSADQEVALGRAIEDGRQAQQVLGGGGRPRQSQSRRRLEALVVAGSEAKHRFIQSNLRLVVSIAKRYQSSGLPLLDLIQEGNLGLIRAVEKFDHRKGFKFSTYATWWIRQAITRAIADKGRTIRVPVHMVEAVQQVSRSAAQLVKDLGREPTPEEISGDTGLTVERVLEAQRVTRDPVSLFERVGDDDAELADFLEDANAEVPYEVAAASLRRDEVRHVLEALSGREQQVLELRYGLLDGETRTLEEVGDRFSLTRERIRQIEAKALAKLRHPSTPPVLRDLVAL
jgi:RNA polymerase primary sigma factor